jgi:hypothetical protein
LITSLKLRKKVPPELKKEPLRQTRQVLELEHSTQFGITSRQSLHIPPSRAYVCEMQLEQLKESVHKAHPKGQL